MDQRPSDLDASRLAVAVNEMTATASQHLTEEVAMGLEFHELVPFKTLLKKFFSAAPWTEEDSARLSNLVTSSGAAAGWWEHDLGGGLTMAHGFRESRYELWVTGAGGGAGGSLFDRAFAGPVVPEATPHPRKVKFNIGGEPAPGVWYRRGDQVDNAAASSLLEDDDVTDVMVAGDFVTIGLRRGASWDARLDDLLETVTDLFWDEGRTAATPPPRTRDELVGEGLRTASPEQLHLLDPDDPEHRARLEEALRNPGAEVRRIALATLAQSEDQAFVAELLTSAYEDDHRIVRRMAVDGAADLASEEVRPLLERALDDADAWARWKAIRGLAELGVGQSKDAIAALANDEDFQVRLEVADVLRA
jgi:hypothetical protein